MYVVLTDVGDVFSLIKYLSTEGVVMFITGYNELGYVMCSMIKIMLYLILQFVWISSHHYSKHFMLKEVNVFRNKLSSFSFSYIVNMKCKYS